ncbi:MAG: Peptidase, M23/M37 family [uncultured Sulfurovum sp.]|uniref:Peptidase, M23/M37 family n=1 Tax=uncultured Sulfurovum sp. TaxID=269237 RepID=A0A6S6TJB1_9BACT|nr:MAG: Peptidase, M23/M37 family [uncultured Sulfurovum sp.]
MRNRSSSNSGFKIIIGILLVGIIVGAGYVYTAPEFERESPIIESQKNIFWNRTDPLKLKFTDNFALKHYELILSDGVKRIMIGSGDFEKTVKEQTLLVHYPKSNTLNKKAKKLQLSVSVDDNSMWNFFQGNKTLKTIDIQIDHKRPTINILANSYSITQGGSALVVFYAEDKNLDTLHVEVGDKEFKVQPYKKEGYFAALIAWPFNKKDFDAKIVATDKANNKRITEIPFYLKNRSYKVSWIRVKDKFLDGKITDLASADPEYADITDKIEKFVAVNEKMRLKNEEKIHILSSGISSKILDKWKIKKFYPLKNGAKVASYGDERHYYYGTKDNEVSTSYHVGYDLASTKMAVIKTSNAGKVVFSNENGIYGNMPMIDHGLGLYSLYGHCSQLLVKEGDEVVAGQAIAKTGISGLALGDHLHFGILVQGIEVRPVEWFDSEWIRKNIDIVFSKADKIIFPS